MTGLVAFLQARLDELERTVVAEHGGPGFFWSSGDRALTTEVAITGPDGQVWPQWRDVPPKAVFWLADIAAKRQIIDSFAAAEQPLTTRTAEFAVVRMVLRLLAAPYADRPGYRDEWRP